MPKGVYDRKPRGSYNTYGGMPTRTALMASAAAEAALAAETDEEIMGRIEKTFSVLNRVGQGVVNGDVRSLIVSGAPGCGKTHTLEDILNRGERMGKIKLSSVKGTMSAIGLYQMLYDNRMSNSVILIDDCDKIFEDIDALNILKAALDTSDIRTLHWNKESRVLADADVPRSFDFRGSVVFITNVNLQGQIEAGGKMAPHYDALVSRSMFVDLGIHSIREIMCRIRQVVFSDEYMANQGVVGDQVQNVCSWLESHTKRLQRLSIRTVSQLLVMHKLHDEWEEIAEVTLLKRH